VCVSREIRARDMGHMIRCRGDEILNGKKKKKRRIQERTTYRFRLGLALFLATERGTQRSKVIFISKEAKKSQQHQQQENKKGMRNGFIGDYEIQLGVGR